MDRLEQFIFRYGDLFETCFEHLVGSRVEYIHGPMIKRGYIAGEVELDDGTVLPTDFRPANESEISMNQEFPSDDDLNFDDLYFGNIIGYEINRVEAIADQERQEAYLYFYTSKMMYFEVPIGFNANSAELFGFAKKFIPKDEWEKTNLQ